MKMSRFALSLTLMTLLAAGGCVTAFAEDAAPVQKPGCSVHKGQRHKMDPAKREEMHKRFAQNLGLSAEQDAKIKSIRESFHEAHKAEFEAMKAKHQEMRKLKESGADEQTMAAKREEMKAQFAGLKTAREDLKSQIKAVLTPEQQAKMEAMKAQHKGPRDGGKRSPKAE